MHDRTTRSSGVVITPSAPTPAPAPVALGHDRLLSIQDVCAMTGVCPVTAAKVIGESGKSFRIHRRLFVFQNSLYDYFHQLEGTAFGCNSDTSTEVTCDAD